VFPLFILADMLLCCQIWNLFNLISGSSLNPIQVDLEPKSGEGLSTYEDIGICEFSSMLKLFKLPIFPKLLSEVKDTRIQVFHKLHWLFGVFRIWPVGDCIPNLQHVITYCLY
jgi:hypothetical protein